MPVIPNGHHFITAAASAAQSTDPSHGKPQTHFHGDKKQHGYDDTNTNIKSTANTDTNTEIQKYH